MALFVLMTRLAAGSVRDADTRRAMGKEWLHKVNAACPQVKWLSHYALLGPYDFLDVYEAPDVETAHKVSMISRAEGAVTAESWEALAYDRFLAALSEIS